MVPHQILDSVYLAFLCDDMGMLRNDKDLTCVCIDSLCADSPFHDYFGPSNLKRAFDFCQMMETQMLISKMPIILTVSADGKLITGAIFLIGAYMILKLEMDVDSVMHKIDSFRETIMPFTDVLCGPRKSSFELDIKDCFQALFRAKSLNWVDFGPDGFDADEYKQLDDPLNADMHEVVPGKLLILRGPRDLPNGAIWLDVKREDSRFSHRDFSPQHYAGILQQFEVQVVVRCNAPQYDRRGFEDAGIAVVDLAYEDGGAPPVDVVAKFLAISEAVPGAVAVHCASGLGRTGTLIALYTMKHHGFTAREAMGWLRIVRPGRFGPSLPSYIESAALGIRPAWSIPSRLPLTQTLSTAFRRLPVDSPCLEYHTVCNDDCLRLNDGSVPLTHRPPFPD